MNSNTGLIIGDSPLIKEVEYELPYILNKYFSLGINRIIRRFTTSRHIFLDKGIINLTNNFPNIPVITISNYKDLIINKDKELIDTFTNKTDFFGNLIEYNYINDKNELAWCGFTHDYAISYLLSKGYNNIVLIGAADFINGTHYVIEEDFKADKDLKKESIKYIEHLANNTNTNFYTINKDSIIKGVEYISKEVLLKGDITSHIT